MLEAVEQIPDVPYVREQIARNIRERDLLTKLLRLAQRKAELAGCDHAVKRQADCRKRGVE